MFRGMHRQGTGIGSTARPLRWDTGVPRSTVTSALNVPLRTRPRHLLREPLFCMHQAGSTGPAPSRRQEADICISVWQLWKAKLRKGRGRPRVPTAGETGAGIPVQLPLIPDPPPTPPGASPADSRCMCSGSVSSDRSHNPSQHPLHFPTQKPRVTQASESPLLHSQS